MDMTAHPARVPVFRLLAIGAAVAFAYLLLALLLGFGSSGARADDGGDQGGLLGGVTGAVDSTVQGVTGAVQDTTQAVATTVQQVAQTAPAPVQPVVSTVANTVQAVVEPVAQVAESGVVGSVVTPVVETVTAVPVVGGVVEAIGLDDAATDAATTTDTAVNDLVTAVGDTTPILGGTRPPLVDLPDIESPVGLPGSPVIGSGAQTLEEALAHLTVAGLPAPGWTVAALEDAYAHALPAFTAITAAGTAFTGLVSAGVRIGGILSSALVLGVCTPGGSSPLGPNGAGPGALALAAFAPLVAYRAWVRRSGWSDDVAPPAPTYDTDVSPD